MELLLAFRTQKEVLNLYKSLTIISPQAASFRLCLASILQQHQLCHCQLQTESPCSPAIVAIHAVLFFGRNQPKHTMISAPKNTSLLTLITR